MKLGLIKAGKQFIKPHFYRLYVLWYQNICTPVQSNTVEPIVKNPGGYKVQFLTQSEGIFIVVPECNVMTHVGVTS